MLQQQQEMDPPSPQFISAAVPHFSWQQPQADPCNKHGVSDSTTTATAAFEFSCARTVLCAQITADQIFSNGWILPFYPILPPGPISQGCSGVLKPSEDVPPKEEEAERYCELEDYCEWKPRQPIVRGAAAAMMKSGDLGLSRWLPMKGLVGCGLRKAKKKGSSAQVYSSSRGWGPKHHGGRRNVEEWSYM